MNCSKIVTQIKKHKKIKKGSSGINFENYTKRLVSLMNFDTFEKPPADYKEVSRLTAFQGKMEKKTVTKTKFLQFNDKRFYFSDEIISLPLSHPYLKELVKFKTKMGQRIERYFWDEKENLLAIENKAQELNKRLFLYRQILTRKPQCFLLD